MDANSYLDAPLTGLHNNDVNHQLVARTAMVSLFMVSALIVMPTAQAADIGSQSADTIALNDGDHVTADQRFNGILYGILNQYGRTANINLANDVSISATDSAYTEGVIIQGDNTILNANRLSIAVKGASGIAMDVSGAKDRINLGAGSQITLESNGSSLNNIGLSLRGGSTLQATGLNINVTSNNAKGLAVEEHGSNANLGAGSSISVSGNNSFGLYVFGINGSGTLPASFSATELSINTQGQASYGINNQDEAITILGSNSRISTTGEYASGLWNLGQFAADALSVSVTGQDAIAIESYSGTVNIGADSHLSALKGGGIVANNDSSSAEVNFLGTAQKRNSIVAGGSYGASAQFAGSIVNLTNTDIEVDANGAVTLGLWALGGGRITGDNLSITGASAARGVYAMTDSQIDLTGNTVIHMADPGDMAIGTQHNDGYTASRINADGEMDITGSIAARGGVINLDMASGSRWTGQAYSDGVNGGALNITMQDTSWNMIADSNLDNLELNNSTVNFATESNQGRLTIGNLEGNGSFIMHTDIAGKGNGVDNSGDKVIVTGSSAGEHQITVVNQGSQTTNGSEVLTVVETQDGKATFSTPSKTELGGYLYNLRKKGNDWELYASDSNKPDPDISTGASAGANFLNIGYLINRAENQTLLQRMGYMRQNQLHGDMWVKGFAGKYNSFSGGKLSGFDMKYNGIQFGVDKRVSETLPLYIGPFMGLTTGKPDYGSGDGSVQSSYLGVYGTYVTQDGFYIDAIAKYASLRNHFSVLDSQSNQVSGTGRSDGFSLSLETGQRFNPTPSVKGLYLEPQAEFVYTHQNASNIHETNGLNVSLGSYESMVARASGILGYEVIDANNSVNVYLKTGILREFSGDTAYRLNGSREEHSFKGDWWNNGIGVSAQLNNAHTLYVDLDYSVGHKFDQRQVNGGYRFSF